MFVDRYNVCMNGSVFAWDEAENRANRREALGLVRGEQTGAGQRTIGADAMRAHCDFARMKRRKNPYVRILKQPITIRLDRDTLACFKGMAVERGYRIRV